MEGKKVRILLVEDNIKYVNLFNYLLAEEEVTLKIDIINANNLQQALEYIERETFDVIVLDLFLPDSRGLESIARVQEKNPHVPILILTALDDSETKAQALKQGVKGYLPKDQIITHFLPTIRGLVPNPTF